MNIEKILQDPLINKVELARRMFPGQKYPEPYLNKKINRRYGQSITASDIEKIKNIMDDFTD
jgi:hypothetical protein